MRGSRKTDKNNRRIQHHGVDGEVEDGSADDGDVY